MLNSSPYSPIYQDQVITLPRKKVAKSNPLAGDSPSNTNLPSNLKPTPVYETYWRFAAKRQELYFQRLNKKNGPWTDDPILQTYRFTNVYRAADRVSQYLIRNIIYSGDQNENEVFFRIMLFKIFNKIETWETLSKSLKRVSWREYDFSEYSRILNQRTQAGISIYSPAYIMPPPPFGHVRKFENHMKLLEHMMSDGAPQKIKKTSSLEEVFQVLRSYPGLGDFLAFQYAIDLNYSPLLDFSEMDFVVAGPGAKNGIHKCFADTTAYTYEEIIRIMAEIADSEFHRLGLKFVRINDRPLQLIDIQNIFCEVDKYSRVMHPSIKGKSSRTRIKQKFLPKGDLATHWFPPKWNIAD